MPSYVADNRSFKMTFKGNLSFFAAGALLPFAMLHAQEYNGP